MRCWINFSDILLSSNIYSFVVSTKICSVMLLFFLLSTLLCLGQNWFSSCALFKKLVMHFCSSTLDLLIIFWYLALFCCVSSIDQMLFGYMFSISFSNFVCLLWIEDVLQFLLFMSRDETFVILFLYLLSYFHETFHGLKIINCICRN